MEQNSNTPKAYDNPDFLHDSQLLNQAALNRLKLNAADSKVSDHLLMAFDFQLLY